MKFNLSCILIIFVLVSCKQEKDSVAGDPEKFDVTFNIQGLEQVVPKKAVLASASLKSTSSSSTLASDADITIKNGEDFDYITTMTYDYPETRNKLVAGTSVANSQLVASTKPMKSNIKYRIVVFERVVKDGIDTLKYAAQAEFEAGNTSSKLSLYKHLQYKWVAYSYNNTKAIPVFSETDPMLMSDNADLLYASNNLSNKSSFLSFNNAAIQNLNISFKRLVARLGVEIDGRGMFTRHVKAVNFEIKSKSDTNFGFKKGKLNLLTGVIDTKTVVDYNPFESTMPVDYEQIDSIIGFKDRLVRYTYSAAPITITGTDSLVVSLKSLTIAKSDSSGYYTFNYADKPKKYAFAPAIGVGQTANGGIIMIESGVKLDSKSTNLNYSGSKVDTVIWARGNIFTRVTSLNYLLDATDPLYSRRYAFRAQNTGIHNSEYEDLFSGRGLETAYQVKNNVQGGTYDAPGTDPCNYVYPFGAWENPNVGSGQTNALSSLDDNLTDLPRTYGFDTYQSVLYNYVEYTGKNNNEGGVNSYYPSKNLRLEANGYLRQNVYQQRTFTDMRSNLTIGLYKGFLRYGSLGATETMKITSSSGAGRVESVGTDTNSPHPENTAIYVNRLTDGNQASVRCIRYRKR